jgi:Mycothiol maleylpyruvate isomerase N-terminal domain
MALLRVDTRPLVPRLRAELTALLASLPGGDWAHPTACPGWSVHDLAAHLLGVELGNVSVRRDHWGLGPGHGEDLDAWLSRFNQQWVDAARRISPALLTELIDLAGRRFEEHLATLDLDAAGGPVQWATGSDPAPVWLDVAREYMERYVHQHQMWAQGGQIRVVFDFTIVGGKIVAIELIADPEHLAQLDVVPLTSRAVRGVQRG